MSKDIRDRLGLESSVVQAGMAGVARAPLAAAVSRAGGLGALGLMVPSHFSAELRRAKELAEGRPVAANLLVPFIRKAHVAACIAQQVKAVTLFFGFDRSVVRSLKAAGIFVFHQVGSLQEAKRALAEGADGLVAQGKQAGGHLRATKTLKEFLPEVAEMATGHPVLAAGGVYDRASAGVARSLGADGVCAGTRFLLCEESNAHELYKARLLEARETLVTLLFSFGWPAPHRVVSNRATERWCRGRRQGPKWVGALNRLTGPIGRVVPFDRKYKLMKRQRLSLPFYTPVPMEKGMDERLVDLTPLYAGECTARIGTLRSAAEVVSDLAAGIH